MFVAINNRDKSAIYLDGVIKKARNAGEITPEYAMEILAKTNHRTNIKTLVKAVKDKCATKEDILPYREFILSCVDGRDVSGEVLLVLQEMADLCECCEEFEKANKKPKFYEKFDCTNVVYLTNTRQYEELKGKGLRVFWDEPYLVEIDGFDFSKIKELKFNARNIVLRDAKNLPEVLDFSMCSKVRMPRTDLSGNRKIKLKEGGELDLQYSWIRDEEFWDLSECDNVDLSFACIDRNATIKFKKGAKVSLRYVKCYSSLDFSMCSEVNLKHCDFRDVKEIKFGEGAKVDLRDAENLPQKLDVSKCSSVYWGDAYLSNVEEIKFKDEEQKEWALRMAKSFYGKVVYTDVKNKVLSVNGGMEM